VVYVQVSQGFGFQAARVSDEAALRQTLQQAVDSGAPWVIDACIDPDGYA
jgi:thiamine pyrophosphate-dependent acetolactate synthase large subunit-like protein